MTGLDLREGDKRWLAVLEGMHDEYDGEAVNPRYLSLLERWMGYGKAYAARAASSEGSGSPRGTPTKAATQQKQQAAAAELELPGEQ
jgi:hypothetical protein